MTEYTFDNNSGTGDNDMDVAANWDPESIPLTADTAINIDTILLGTCVAPLENQLTINGGTFNGTVNNIGTISTGTFNGKVTTPGSDIFDGTFNGEVELTAGAQINGGTFSATSRVSLGDATIVSGTFAGTVDIVDVTAIFEAGTITGKVRIFVKDWTWDVWDALDLTGASIDVYAANTELYDNDGAFVVGMDTCTISLMRKEANFKTTNVSNFSDSSIIDCSNASGYGGPWMIVPSSQDTATSWLQNELNTLEPGGTLTIPNGTYTGNFIIPASASGSLGNETTIQAESKYGVIIVAYQRQGDRYYPINCQAAYSIIDGIRIIGGQYDGLRLHAGHITVQNCYISNCGRSGIMGPVFAGSGDWTIAKTVIEFCGGHPLHDHGMYLYGPGNITIHDCVIRNNASCGLALDNMDNCSIYNCIIHGNGLTGILATGDGTIIRHCTVAYNHLSLVADGQAISISGDTSVVANSIATSRLTTTTAIVPTGDVTILYNIMYPDVGVPANNLAADPVFLDPARGVWLIGVDSPAVGYANNAYLTALDFFERVRLNDCGAANSITVGELAAYEAAMPSGSTGYAYRNYNDVVPELFVLP